MEASQIFIIRGLVLGCKESFRNCFCVSFGTNKTEDYFLGVKVDKGYVYMDIKDDEFKDIFIGEQADFDIKFVREYISPDAPYGKERIGYIVDRVGYKEYKKWALDNVKLSDIAEVSKNVNWSGMHYVRK